MTAKNLSVNAITLITANMEASIAFYKIIGMEITYGGPNVPFTSLKVGPNYLNLQLDVLWIPPSHKWGRFIVIVDDVDDVYARLISADYKPTMAPKNAIWGERYFHITDTAGHEVSIARKT